MTPPIMILLLQIGVPLALAGTIAWLADYSRTRWWRHVVGRNLTIKTLIIFALLIISAIDVFAPPSYRLELILAWCEVGLVWLIGPVLFWRLVIFRRLANSARHCPNGHAVLPTARYCPQCAHPMRAEVTVNGLDYAFSPHPPVTAVKAAGCSFVCRYISPIAVNDTNGKNLLAGELAALLTAGLSVVMVFESTSGRMKTGQGNGVADAVDADAVVKALGMAGVPIYFACDFDATPADQTAINAYLDGVASVIGRARTGIYGGYYPVSRALDAGKATYAWQTYAWSGGQWDTRAQIRQTKNGVSVGGASCDLDVATAADFGQFPRPVIPVNPPVPDLPPAPSPVPVTPPLEDPMPAGPISAPKGSWEAFSWVSGKVSQIVIVCGGWQEMQAVPPKFHLLINHNSGKFYLTDEIELPASGTYTYRIGAPSDCNGFAIWRVDGGDADGKAPLSYHTL